MHRLVGVACFSFECIYLLNIYKLFVVNIFLRTILWTFACYIILSSHISILLCNILVEEVFVTGIMALMLGLLSNVEENVDTQETPTNITIPLVETRSSFTAEELAIILYWKQWSAYSRILKSLYLSPLIVVLGYLGNILTIIIFNKTSLSRLTTSIYFKALAVTDMCVLLTWLNYDFYREILPSGDPLYGTFVYCNILKFVQAYSRHLSGVILSALSVDRMIGVVYPLKYKYICTKKRVYIILGTLMTVLFVLDLIYLIENESVKLAYSFTDTTKLPTCKFRSFLKQVSFLCSLVFLIYMEIHSIHNHVMICLCRCSRILML